MFAALTPLRAASAAMETVPIDQFGPDPVRLAWRRAAPGLKQGEELVSRLPPRPPISSSW
jgi:hypothetical protein